MFDWIAIGFGVTFGAFLFTVALVLSVIALIAIGVGFLFVRAILHRHNNRIRLRNENHLARVEARWKDHERMCERIVGEARVARARPMLTPARKGMTDAERRAYYGDPGENLRLHFPDANIVTGGFYRPRTRS